MILVHFHYVFVQFHIMFLIDIRFHFYLSYIICNKKMEILFNKIILKIGIINIQDSVKYPKYQQIR